MNIYTKYFPESYGDYTWKQLFAVVCENCHERFGQHNNDRCRDGGTFQAPLMEMDKPKTPKVVLDDSLFEVE